MVYRFWRKLKSSFFNLFFYSSFSVTVISLLSTIVSSEPLTPVWWIKYFIVMKWSGEARSYSNNEGLKVKPTQWWRLGLLCSHLKIWKSSVEVCWSTRKLCSDPVHYFFFSFGEKMLNWKLLGDLSPRELKLECERAGLAASDKDSHNFIRLSKYIMSNG